VWLETIGRGKGNGDAAARRVWRLGVERIAVVGDREVGFKMNAT